MTERFQVHFETTGRQADGRVVREYIRPAIQRFDDQDLITQFHFFRYGHTDDQKSEVRFRLNGHREQIIDIERETWDRLKSDDVIRDWRVTDWPPESLFGEEEEKLANRLFETASRMSFHYYEEFDETEVGPVDTLPDDGVEGFGVGMWVLLHALFNHQAYDVDEEMDACLENINNVLHRYGKINGIHQMEERAETLIDDIEASTSRTKQILREQSGE